MKGKGQLQLEPRMGWILSTTLSGCLLRLASVGQVQCGLRYCLLIGCSCLYAVHRLISYIYPSRNQELIDKLKKKKTTVIGEQHGGGGVQQLDYR